MRNLLAFLSAAALTLVGVGWYLNWFQVHTTPGDPGRRNVNIELDTNKIGDDLSKGGQKLKGALEKNNAPTTVPAEAGKSEEAEIPPPPGVIMPKEEIRSTGVISSPKLQQ